MWHSRSSHVVDEGPIERAVVYCVAIFHSIPAAVAACAATGAVAARATTGAVATRATTGAVAARAATVAPFFRSVNFRVASRDEFLVFR